MSSNNERALAALSKVIDPELSLPITELNMVGDISFDSQIVSVKIKLTVSHCPRVNEIETKVSQVLQEAFPDLKTQVTFSVMSADELNSLKRQLRGAEKTNPFGPGSSTRVILVGSGKGGVGKSTLTANLAVELANNGFNVGVIDADVYGFSMTQQLGITERPTRLDDMMLPPTAFGVKAISIGMFLSGNEPVSWRGPMLHKAMEQFLTDVYWGQLDFLLVDMPPGTGDVSISIGQLLPNAKALVITTAQSAAATVAVRSGLAALKAGHELIGVVENFSYLIDPQGNKQALLGFGGGTQVSETLSQTVGTTVPLLSQIPISSEVSNGSDAGQPIVLGESDDPAALAIKELAKVISETKLDKSARTLNVKLGS